jgi:Flp pilus assembly protein TadG
VLRNTRGSTIIEFAMVLTPLMLFVLATLEFGYRVYLNGLVAGVLAEAARLASVGDKTGPEIDTFIKTRVSGLISASKVTVNKTRFYNFSNVGKPEKITQDIDPKGTYNSGDCYEDANNNGVYDSAIGDEGLGTADDVVSYKVTVNYNALTPIGNFVSWDKAQTFTETAVLRNQPFTSRAAPTVRCN